MRRSSTCLIAALAGIAALALSAKSVRAGSCLNIAHIYTYDHVPTQDQTNWSDQHVTIPKFNPADGTLCMVVVRRNAMLQASINATNTSPTSPANLTATITDTVVINPPADTPLATVTHSFPFGPQSFIVPAGGSTSWGFGDPDPLLFTNSQSFTNLADLAQFTGAGQNLDFPSVDGNGSFSFSTTSGNANVVGIVTAGAHIAVEYYIPEPASFGLLAAGLLLIRRRSRKIR